MNDNEKLELFEKIMNKELAVCESCDNTTDYVRGRVICNECKKRKKEARKITRIIKTPKSAETVAAYLSCWDAIEVQIMNKELTICETCDNIFDYVAQKIYCDECGRARRYSKERKWREENREKVNAKNREYCAKNREKIKARKRKYYEENHEKIKARGRKYYAENREKILAKRHARYHAKKNQEE